MTIWTVSKDSDGYRLNTANLVVPCLVGKAGLIAAADKREGDMATPAGDWPLRRVYYRADRIALPAVSLPLPSTSQSLSLPTLSPFSILLLLPCCPFLLYLPPFPSISLWPILSSSFPSPPARILISLPDL